VGAYLTLDWPEEYGDPWSALADFIRSEPALAPQLPVEIATLLDGQPSENQLRALIVDDMGSGYTPEGDGTSFREWLSQVQTRAERLLTA
jgi:hypothetical protein